LKSLKKYISVLAAIAVMGAFTVPAYAQMVIDDTDEPTSESVDVIEDNETTEEPEDEEGEDPGSVGDPASDIDVEVLDTDADDLEEPEDTEAPETVLGDPISTSASQTTTAAPVTTAAPATTTAAAGAITYTRTDPYAMYALENVNVRQGPGTNYSVIGSVNAPNEVKVLGTNGSWVAIDYYGGVGFVSGSYLTSTAPTTTAGTTAAQTTAAPVQTTQQQAADTTQPAETAEQQWNEGIPDTTIEDNTPDVVIDDDDNTAVTTTEEKTPVETTTEETTAAAAASTTDNNGVSGITGILIALACAVGTFLLIGVVPVVIHSIYHKKMYEY